MTEKTKSAALLAAVPALILAGSYDYPKVALDVLAPVAASALIAFGAFWLHLLATARGYGN